MPSDSFSMFGKQSVYLKSQYWVPQRTQGCWAVETECPCTHSILFLWFPLFLEALEAAMNFLYL